MMMLIMDKYDWWEKLSKNIKSILILVFELTLVLFHKSRRQGKWRREAEKKESILPCPFFLQNGKNTDWLLTFMSLATLRLWLWCSLPKIYFFSQATCPFGEEDEWLCVGINHPTLDPTNNGKVASFLVTNSFTRRRRKGLSTCLVLVQCTVHRKRLSKYTSKNLSKILLQIVTLLVRQLGSFSFLYIFHLQRSSPNLFAME